jgi:hypothetical protein
MDEPINANPTVLNVAELPTRGTSSKASARKSRLRQVAISYNSSDDSDDSYDSGSDDSVREDRVDSQEIYGKMTF